MMTLIFAAYAIYDDYFEVRFSLIEMPRYADIFAAILLPPIFISITPDILLYCRHFDT